MGWQDPDYRWQAKMTSIRCRPSTKNTHKGASPHVLLTRRLILSPCKTTTMWHCSNDCVTLQQETFTMTPPTHTEKTLPRTQWRCPPPLCVLPGRGCWCTAAAARREVFPGWWPVEPWAAAPSGWGCPAGREPAPRQHTSWTGNLLKTGLHTAAGPQRCNSLVGQKNKQKTVQLFDSPSKSKTFYYVMLQI